MHPTLSKYIRTKLIIWILKNGWVEIVNSSYFEFCDPFSLPGPVRRNMQITLWWMRKRHMLQKIHGKKLRKQIPSRCLLSNLAKTPWSWGRMDDFCSFFRKKREIKFRRQLLIQNERPWTREKKGDEFGNEDPKKARPQNERPWRVERARLKRKRRNPKLLRGKKGLGSKDV